MPSSTKVTQLGDSYACEPGEVYFASDEPADLERRFSEQVTQGTVGLRFSHHEYVYVARRMNPVALCKRTVNERRRYPGPLRESRSEKVSRLGELANQRAQGWPPRTRLVDVIFNEAAVCGTIQYPEILQSLQLDLQ
ncbi:MAG: hypothetical protein M3403_06745 [Gemmatimonadota bacterium]|nr:hypothetical protein [Gemmatimonadota bacterium]